MYLESLLEMKEWQIAEQELAIESQQASAEYRTTGRLASEESIRDWTPKDAPNYTPPEYQVILQKNQHIPPNAGVTIPNTLKYTNIPPCIKYKLTTIKSILPESLPIKKYQTQVTVFKLDILQKLFFNQDSITNRPN